MSFEGLSKSDILTYIPQQKPFRFVEEIISLSTEKAVGAYTFKNDEFFYKGHFPEKPITPGVILLECMCQIGIVAFGIYLLSLEVEHKEIRNWLTMFADGQIECIKPVYPSSRVIVTSKKVFWKRKKLRADMEMHDENNQLLALATASGIGVSKK